MCLQETKHGSFDLAYIRKFCPKHFQQYCYHPSNGASRGTIIIWQGARFTRNVAFENEYAQIIEFHSTLTNQRWFLTNIYAPCTDNGLLVLRWLSSYQNHQDQQWLLLGDFNLICKVENLNKLRGNLTLMMEFNLTISQLGFKQYQSMGRNTLGRTCKPIPSWKNLSGALSLKNAWLIRFPGTNAHTLPRDTLDHTPWIIKVKINVPRPKTFRFENFWL